MAGTAGLGMLDQLVVKVGEHFLWEPDDPEPFAILKLTSASEDDTRCEIVGDLGSSSSKVCLEYLDRVSLIFSVAFARVSKNLQKWSLAALSTNSSSVASPDIRIEKRS